MNSSSIFVALVALSALPVVLFAVPVACIGRHFYSSVLVVDFFEQARESFSQENEDIWFGTRMWTQSNTG